MMVFEEIVEGLWGQGVRKRILTVGYDGSLLGLGAFLNLWPPGP